MKPLYKHSFYIFLNEQLIAIDVRNIFCSGINQHFSRHKKANMFLSQWRNTVTNKILSHSIKRVLTSKTSGIWSCQIFLSKILFQISTTALLEVYLDNLLSLSVDGYAMADCHSSGQLSNLIFGWTAMWKPWLRYREVSLSEIQTLDICSWVQQILPRPF